MQTSANIVAESHTHFPRLEHDSKYSSCHRLDEDQLHRVRREGYKSALQHTFQSHSESNKWVWQSPNLSPIHGDCDNRYLKTVVNCGATALVCCKRNSPRMSWILPVFLPWNRWRALVPSHVCREFHGSLGMPSMERKRSTSDATSELPYFSALSSLIASPNLASGLHHWCHHWCHHLSCWALILGLFQWES